MMVRDRSSLLLRLAVCSPCSTCKKSTTPVVQDLCTEGGSDSQTAAVEALWEAVSASQLAEAVDNSIDAKAGLLELLTREAPSCLGTSLQVSGELHAFEAGDHKHLLLAASHEEWRNITASMGLQRATAASNETVHTFSTPCHVVWDSHTGIGTATLSEGSTHAACGEVSVQVARGGVLSRQREIQPSTAGTWMWDLIWAESVQKSKVNL
jgi:hypothetical protein